MTKFLFRDEPYFYRWKRSGSTVGEYWIYKKRKGFLGLFKYKRLGKIDGLFWKSEKINVRFVREFLDKYLEELKPKKILCIECSPEITELYESQKS